MYCAAGDKTGEGAVWSAEEQAVYWCDINRFLVHRYDEQTQSTQSWFFDEPVVAIALTTEAGRFLLALASKLIWWWPATDWRVEQGFQLPGFPQVRLNDGRADPLGNFWVGSMANNVLPDGSSGDVGPGAGLLFRITPAGEVTQWRDNLGISNTLCWSPDHATFYFGDSLANQIYAYDYCGTDGSIANEQVFFAGFDRGVPDGSAMDAAGYLWNCRFGGGCLVRVAPDGAIDRLIEMPVSNLTTCTRADCKEAVGLIDDLFAGALLADKAYDTNAIINAATEKGMQIVIPPKKNRIQQRDYDEELSSSGT